jgi:phasin
LHSAKAKKFIGKAKKVLTPTLAPLAMSQRNNYIAVQQNIIVGSALQAWALSREPQAKRVRARGVIMTNTYSPQAAAEQARDSFRQAAKEFEKLKLDTTVPESVRALAEKTVNQSREAYERGKEALEEAFDSLERSFDAAGQGATAFNRKLIDLAQRNLNSAFDLAKSLAGAKNLGEIVELQSAFIRHQFDVFASQAGEIRALTTKIAADTTEPIKDQMSRSFESIRKP